MPNENSVNLDEVARARKIRLVVTESDSGVAESHTGVVESHAGAAESHMGGVDSCVDVAPKTETDRGEQQISVPPLPSQQASVAAQPVGQTESIYQGHPDPEKIMRDLPVDEFFRVLEQSTPEQLQTIIRSFEKGARTKGGSKLLQRIIDVPDGPRSIMSTVLWWEWRRPLYNLTLGLAGLPSLLILSLFGMGQTAILCALFYGFLANVCYSLGAPAEVVARACWKEKAGNYGPVLLTLGTIFSLILTVFLQLLVCSVIALGSIIHQF